MDLFRSSSHFSSGFDLAFEGEAPATAEVVPSFCPPVDVWDRGVAGIGFKSVESQSARILSSVCASFRSMVRPYFVLICGTRSVNQHWLCRGSHSAASYAHFRPDIASVQARRGQCQVEWVGGELSPCCGACRAKPGIMGFQQGDYVLHTGLACVAEYAVFVWSVHSVVQGPDDFRLHRLGIVITVVCRAAALGRHGKPAPGFRECAVCRSGVSRNPQNRPDQDPDSAASHAVTVYQWAMRMGSGMGPSREVGGRNGRFPCPELWSHGRPLPPVDTGIAVVQGSVPSLDTLTVPPHQEMCPMSPRVVSVLEDGCRGSVRGRVSRPMHRNAARPSAHGVTFGCPLLLPQRGCFRGGCRIARFRGGFRYRSAKYAGNHPVRVAMQRELRRAVQGAQPMVPPSPYVTPTAGKQGWPRRTPWGGLQASGTSGAMSIG